MEHSSALIVSLIVTLGFIVLRMPVSICLALGGLIGIVMIDGFEGLNILGTIVYRHSFGFTLLAVPLFVFMGSLLFHHGMGEKLYDGAYKWIGYVRGGLGMATTIMCALFAFMCGSSTAAIASIGRIALSEMEKRKYDRAFSLGTTVSAGGLAVLIPPSVIMIIYASVSLASLGKLFIAGIFPGILVAMLMMGYIFLHATINPKLAPSGTRSLWGDRVRALPNLIPVVAMFLTIIGGIYFGIWNAIEAGSAGAIVAFFICIGYRRLSLHKVIESALETIQTTTMIFTIIIGANILSHVFYLTGVSKSIENIAVGFDFPPWLIIFLIAFIMMILGMILDVVALCMVCIPIFLPLVTSLGFDPVWFGVFFVLSAEMALITPPVGVNLYVIYGIAPQETTLWEVVRGALPYIGIFWVVLILITFFQKIAMWLPSTMLG